MYSVNNAAPFSGNGSAVSTAWGKFICVSVLEYLIPYEDVKSFPGGPAGPISPFAPVSPFWPFGIEKERWCTQFSKVSITVASSPGSNVSVSSIAICSVLPISPGSPLGPISPLSPFGILKSKTTSTGVPTLITSALSSGSIVFIFPICIVEGPCSPLSPFSPISPFGPVSPLSPFGPVSPLSPLGPVSPLSPFGILKFKIASFFVPTFSTLASS